jgi:CheY-like chemotaxis protein
MPTSMKKQPSILIVEDETILRDAYKMVLSVKGYDVTTAENGKIALDMLKGEEPDLILLDMLMPVMGGKEFLTHAALPSNHPNVKVIVYSNLSDQATIEEVLNMGVEEHILKSSMSPNDLVEHMDALLKS